jgi:outer membrane protein TolC
MAFWGLLQLPRPAEGGQEKQEPTTSSSPSTHRIGLSVAASSLRPAEPSSGNSNARARIELPTTTVALTTLVEEALNRNLALLSDSRTPRIADSEIQAAGSVFNPTATFSSSYLWQSRATFGEDGRVPGSVSTTTFGGNIGAALPYSAVSVVGGLPTGTRYSVSLQSARRTEQPLVAQINAVEFDTALTVSLSHPLLRGSGTTIATADIKTARLAAAASRGRFARLVQEFVAQVETAYWGLEFTETSEATARESLERAQVLLGRNQRLEQLQLIAAVDTLVARQGVAARQATLVDAIRQRRDTADALMFLVYGREAAARVRTEEIAAVHARIEAPSPPSLDQAEAEALSRRPDLLALREDLGRLHLVEQVAKNGLLPGLNLTGSVTTQTQNASRVQLWGVDRAGDVRSAGWQCGIEFALPLGNDLAKARHAQATLRLTQQELALASVENAVRNEIRQAVRGITSSVERLEYANEAVTLAQQQYKSETQRLDLGLTDSFRLLQYEDQVAAAQLEEARARFALASAMSAYSLATVHNTDRYPAASALLGGRETVK